MPKQIQPPIPTYGSPEWKAMRTKMVGTPEWKAANNYVEPNKPLDPMAQGGRLNKVELPFTPFGKTLTTAEKQAQSPLYNPLYDPSSAEYKQNLVNISQPNRPIQNPLVQSLTAPVSTPQIPALQPQPEGPVSTQPKITLPAAFQQNYNTPPGSPQQSMQGIKMPDIKKPLQGFNAGSNWTDFLTVANNRYTR